MEVAEFYSDYYDKRILLTQGEAETLIEIYLEVAKKLNFKPDVEEADSIMESPAAYDTVAYHVEEFGSDEDGYEEIEHLF